MPVLAIWFPPVGLFGAALAVLGAVVSIVEFKGWKRITFATLFVLLGIGEGIAIFNADATHKLEVDGLTKAIKQVQDTLTATQLQNASDMGYLKAKLEDEYKMNATLSKFAPAIMKLAQTSAEFTRKQYEAKVTSDKELRDFTMGVVSKIRAFSHKHRLLGEQQSAELMNSVRQSNLTEAEKQQRWNQETQKMIQLYYQRDFEFRDSILPDAIYAKNELLKRKVSEPALAPMQKSEVDMVMRGILAGPYPELALADYLELMARQLSP